MLTCSCWTTKQVKQVRWQNYTFHLAVSDGGATTNFNWKVTARYQGLFGTREKTVFEAYGGPYLTDMQVENSTLVLLAYDGQAERIELDLQHLEALLEDSVRYHRYSLRQSNSFYQEPAFINAQREKEQYLDLEAAQRRQQQEAQRH
ncbi:hypothetical protein [Hymenobacter volaticus]|uniref:Uncharacterized protein n=1 Tax=Hymenobacter volaticus TaxID=2932254 RepID=A0ABY4GFM3_9BACT|nr:hypothetical protein [Hymenobacter volaticus]UOQ69605.1 hypothetical protein MUN86_29305 [Hymenobacter volaticus]